jgi:hypothetical protein
MEEGKKERDQSSDSIATSEEFEDLGQTSKNATENNDSQSINSHPADEISCDSKPSPEMEIGNNGNIGDLQDTLNEALNEENNQISGE